MKSMTATILIVTTLTTALIAGLFYSYSCSVNPGLSRLPDKEYLSAMQSINKAILNPMFFLSFMGTLILLPLSSYLSYGHPAFWWILSAAIVYVVGVFGVTVTGNVPLNEALALFDIQSATPDEIIGHRKTFEHPWNRLHTIRTIAVVVSLVFLIIGSYKR
jgi:uncharacterized membrane protein